MFHLGKKVALGLDIGSSYVKLVELTQNLGKPELTSIAVLPAPEGAIIDGVVNNKEALIKVLREIFSSVKTTVKHVAISISGNAVIIKRITIPEMTDSELDEHIVWEAEQYLPSDLLNDVHIDYNKVDMPSRPGHMEIMLVAAKRSIVRMYSDLLAEIGFVPKIIDVDCFALLNIFQHAYSSKPGEYNLVINVGSVTSNLIVVRNNQAVYTREFEFGGRHFTEILSRQLNISLQEAETHKVRHTLKNVFAAEFEGIIEIIMKEFILRVREAVDYFYSFNDDAPITTIYTSGGGAKLPLFNKYLQDAYSVSVVPLDVFSKISYNKKVFEKNYIRSVTPVVAIAAGLAMRQLG